VRVLDGEDVASHTAPESCVAFREGRDEALTGDCVGQPLTCWDRIGKAGGRSR
jgi:hypothetical protein